MADLFQGVDQAPGPFVNVVPPTDIDAPSPALARFRRSQVVAAAKMDVASPDILKNFQDLQHEYMETAALYGDTQDDIAVATERQQRQTRALLKLADDAPQIDPTGALQQGAVLAARESVAGDVQRAREAALEKEATERILDLAASGNTVQAAAQINLIEHGTVMDQLRDNSAKAMILQREIDKAQEAYSKEPWFSQLLNFALLVLPQSSLSRNGLIDSPDVVKNWYDWLQGGDRARNEASSLWNNSDPEDFARIVREQLIPNLHQNATLFGYTDKSEYLNLLTGIQNTSRPLDRNYISGVEFGSLLGPAELMAGGKFAASLPRMLLGLGARREAGGALANAARQLALEGTEAAVNKAGMASVNDLVDDLSTTIMKTEPGLPNSVPVQAAANDALYRGQDLDKLLQTGRFAPGEEEAAIAQFIEQTREKLGADNIVDVRAGRTVLTDDSAVRTVDFVLGSDNTKGWATELEARNFGRGLGYADSEAFVSADGQWFATVSRDMPETGAYTNVLNVKTSNVLSRFLLGAGQRSDDFLHAKAIGSENVRNKVINDHVRELYKEIKIDPRSKERVAQLWGVGANEKKWFTEPEARVLWQRAFNRDLSEKEWSAYQGLRNINDYEYAIRNDIRWKELALRGVETGTVDTGLGTLDRAAMTVDEGFSKGLRGQALNSQTGEILTKLTPEDAARLKNDGYIQLHLEEPMTLTNGKDVDTLIVKREALSRERLRRDQGAYSPGGHRIYKEKYFSKQTSKQILDDGTEVLRSPKTHMVGTKAEVAFWVEKMEAARLIAIGDNPSAAAIDNVFAGHPGFPSGDDFLKGIEKGTYDKDHSFGTYFDREMPSEYHGGGRSYLGPEEEGINQYLRTHGRLYYSQKGDTALVDWHGKQAPTLDAFESTNRAFLNIANLSSFNDYKITAVDRWMKKFEPYLEKAPPGTSAMQMFLDGKPNRLAHQERIVQALEDQRTIIQRNLGWKTQKDLEFADFQRSITEYTMGLDPKSVRHEVSRKLSNWFEETNPLQAMRGLAFDLKLGLFNPVQMFLQASTYLAIAAIDPAAAAKSVVSNPMLRIYLRRTSTPETLEKMVSAGMHKAAGFDDPENFRAFMGAAKASGFFSINESHSLMNAMGPASTFNLTGSAMQDARQAGRFFFNEGETLNRMTAFRSAWDSTIKRYGDKIDNIPPAQVLSEVQHRAETLAFSMSRSSQAWWQQGVTSIPTQFFAYQARMAEMMFGGQLTRAERARLFVSQSLLYGAAGVPGASVVSDLIKAKTGEAPDLGTIGGFMDRGFVDNLLYGVTGQDMMIGDRLGTGAFLGDTVGELFGFSKFGETNTMDILGGATWSIGADLFKDLKPFLTYASAESGGDTGRPLTERALKNLAMNISTLSNLTKAMAVWNYGEYVTTSGRTMATDIPNSAAFTIMLFGAAPGEMDEIGARMAYTKNKSKVVDEAAKVVEQYRVEMLNHPERAEELGDEINAFVNMVNPEIRQQVLAKAHTRVDPSLYASTGKRMERDRNQREIIRRMEESR